MAGAAEMSGRNALFKVTPEGMRIRNAEDAAILLRGLDECDRSAHLDHLLRLTPADRRSRFHSATGDEALRGYSRSIDWCNAIIFGVFVDGVLRGVGELMPLREGAEGEISVSVEEAFQHAGLGRILIAALVIAARRAGMHTVRMLYFRDNDGMRALARSVGAKSTISAGVMEGVLSLAQPEDVREPAVGMSPLKRLFLAGRRGTSAGRPDQASPRLATP